MGLRIYVTGDTGFVGSRLAEAWCATHELAGCSRQAAPMQAMEHQVVDLAEDPRSMEDLLEALKPDVVVHTAAVSQPALLARDLVRGRRVNVEAAHWIARWCRRRDRLLLAFSSDTVYGDAALEEAPAGGWTEQVACAPAHLYGRSKADMEAAVREQLPSATLLRSSLLWGRSLPGQNSFSGWLLGRVSQDAPVPVFRDNRRHMLAAGALADMLDRLLGRLLAGGEAARPLQGPINLGGAHYLSREDFARLLFRHLGLDEGRLLAMDTADAQLAEAPARELPLDLNRLEQVLGALPRVEEWLGTEYPAA
jgi:dTDP-4-dehydrorhamnose reductase